MDPEAVILESRAPFSSSLLWDLQQQYYTDSGIDAWCRNEVPHNITSNPAIASEYVELLLAFYTDLLAQKIAVSPVERLYIVELGAGLGCFSFYFLRRLKERCSELRIPLNFFCYVMTDIVEKNIQFWKGHPELSAFMRDGVLDVAEFNIASSDVIELQFSQRKILAGTLSSPLVVVSNYVWDTVPQDLYHCSAGRWYPCVVTLQGRNIPDNARAADLLARVEWAIEPDFDCEIDPLADLALHELLGDYSAAGQFYLLAPRVGLDCTDRLAALANGNLLMLTADKGSDLAGDQLLTKPPELALHGSVSLNVNYHAFARHFERRGGCARFVQNRSVLNVGALLIADDSSRFSRLFSTFEETLRKFGPDDRHLVLRQALRNISSLCVEEILAVLRLVHCDCHQLVKVLPQLSVLSRSFSPAQCAAVADVLERAWRTYFQGGMACDLPFGIACIYFEMRGYERALHYFRLSVIQYGHFTGTYFNIALCCYALGDLPHAVAFLREALAAEPENATFQLQLVRWTQSMASSPQPLEFAAHPAEN